MVTSYFYGVILPKFVKKEATRMTWKDRSTLCHKSERFCCRCKGIFIGRGCLIRKRKSSKGGTHQILQALYPNSIEESLTAKRIPATSHITRARIQSMRRYNDLQNGSQSIRRDKAFHVGLRAPEKTPDPALVYASFGAGRKWGHYEDVMRTGYIRDRVR